MRRIAARKTGTFRKDVRATVLAFRGVSFSTRWRYPGRQPAQFDDRSDRVASERAVLERGLSLDLSKLGRYSAPMGCRDRLPPEQGGDSRQGEHDMRNAKHSNIIYHAKRARQERERAMTATSRLVRKLHFELARYHDALADLDGDAQHR